MIQIIIDELLINIVKSWALNALIVINGILKTLLNNDNADTIYTIITKAMITKKKSFGMKILTK